MPITAGSGVDRSGCDLVNRKAFTGLRYEIPIAARPDQPGPDAVTGCGASGAPMTSK